MRFRMMTYVIAVSLFSALALPTPCPAQNAKPKLPHYTVTDLGTLGGTFSWAWGISNTGWVEGYSTFSGDQVYGAFVWHKGAVTPIGTFGGPDSFTGWSHPSASGAAAGNAETTFQNPLNDYWCFVTDNCVPFLWRNGVMTQLPTLGGYNGQAHGMNNLNEMVGFVENAASYTCGNPLEYEAVIWKNGQVSELSPYPGDVIGSARRINDWGQVAGYSGDACTGVLHAVLWLNRTPIDLGNLGGVLNNQATDINDLGQVVGFSDLSGDTTGHAFLWQWGGMTDLGMLSGDFGSESIGINNFSQVVGGSWDQYGNERAFLWQKGLMTDLNTLIPSGSPLYLVEADDTNDLGQIVGVGVTNTGELHAFLATQSRWQGVRGSATTASPKITLPESVRKLLQGRLPIGSFKEGQVRP